MEKYGRFYDQLKIGKIADTKRQETKKKLKIHPFLIHMFISTLIIIILHYLKL